MTLKRQLLLVSLLALMLPWAGCEFIRETESALRDAQQQMLAGSAQAIAGSMPQYRQQFPGQADNGALTGDQLYGHPLETSPRVDGYFDDWPLDEASFRGLRGADGPVSVVVGTAEGFVYLFVKVADRSPVYVNSPASADSISRADRVTLVSARSGYVVDEFVFAAEAPGLVIPVKRNAFGFAPEPNVHAHWQDVPDDPNNPEQTGGYQLEARIPRNLLESYIGIHVDNASSATSRGVRSSSFSSPSPGLFVTPSSELERIGGRYVQQGLRLIVTDADGWRIATVGNIQSRTSNEVTPASAWLRFAYDALVEPGKEAIFAEPDPSGREQQSYVTAALAGEQSATWFRSPDDGRAIVAVAEPIRVGGNTLGVVVLQQGTEAVLSLRNQGLVRLMNVTMIAMLLVAGALIGYASLLSRRIRKLSVAAEHALETDNLQAALPSSDAYDEIGDLSRSFAYVLGQLGDYNVYLRSLASKLSHELRTPLAIVTSSLENLEHENLSDASAGYTARAKDGADRLRRILSAMSEASRVEELMKNVEPENFDLRTVLDSTVAAYQDVYDSREIVFRCDGDSFAASGSPELLIQMLDKLVDNAVSFSNEGDTVTIGLSIDTESRVQPQLRIDVENPGPPLPDRMRSQLFDSMVSMRGGKDNQHLGLGLYVAKLIAEGHNGRIDADNIDGGVRFSIWIPEGD